MKEIFEKLHGKYAKVSSGGLHLDGITNSGGVKVEYYREINPPKK